MEMLAVTFGVPLFCRRIPAGASSLSTAQVDLMAAAVLADQLDVEAGVLGLGLHHLADLLHHAVGAVVELDLNAVGVIGLGKRSLAFSGL